MTRQELNSERNKSVLLKRRLTRKPTFVCVSKYNTILALRNSVTKKITHLIAPKERNGLIVVCGQEKELYVPRYEPKTAKAWLQEIDETFNKSQEQVQKDCGFYFEKCTLSEKELDKVVLENMQVRLDSLRYIKRLPDEKLSSF